MATKGSNSAASHGEHLHEETTSSRCVTEALTTGTHNFEVSDFSLLDGIGIGEFVRSSTFTVGGYDWNIDLYPDGDKKEWEGAHVSVYLWFAGGESTAGDRVKFSLSLVDKDGKAVSMLPTLIDSETTHTFGQEGNYWGYNSFIEKCWLRHFLYLNDDSLTIRCVLTVLTPRTEGVGNTIISVPPVSILASSSSILAMAKNSTSADDIHDAHRRSGTTTSSRCVTASITATHIFEVSDFSLLGGMGVGKFVGSTTFTAGGCDWNINVYPDGSKLEDDGSYVSVFLYLRNKAAMDAIRVKFSLYLLEKDGKVSRLGDPTLLSHTFESTGGDWGLNKFIEESSRLQKFLRRNNDILTIRCDLTIVQESQSEEAEVVNTIVIPPENLHQDLAEMLKHQDSVDVTFDVDGRLFPAHRCLLAARSPVFKAELFGSMKNPAHHIIKIHDMEPEIFEALLHFIYTDSIIPGCCGAAAAADDTVTLQHLLVAADRYGVDRLRIMCEARLCRGIDVLTVGNTLALAEQHNCIQLKDACLEFIASHDMLSSILETDGFKHLAESCPPIMNEILAKIAGSRAKSKLRV